MMEADTVWLRSAWECEIAKNNELREQLRVAEAVRDDARAASQRYLDEKRTIAASIRAQTMPTVSIDQDGRAFARDVVVPDELIRAMVPKFHSIVEREDHERKLTEAILEQNRLRGELARAEIARDNANDPRNGWAKGARDGWKKGVLETNDKLYAAKVSGVELSWEKIFELINILLEHPP